MPPLKSSPHIAGCILAGGLARRMGGGDKALLELAGRPLLAHVLERLAPQVAHVVLNANGEAARFAVFGVPVMADTVSGLPGPLAGILAGLRWAQGNVKEASHVLTVTGDAPFIPQDLGERLNTALEARPGAIAIAQSIARSGAQSGGHIHPVIGRPVIGHPVIGLWPVAIADQLERDLVKGARSVNAWCEAQGAIPVTFGPVMIGGRAVDPFFNANTPLELAEARLIAQRLTFQSPVVGIAGWKNSGKTTLVTRLVETLTARGHRVSTVKFSHHEGHASEDGKVRDTSRHVAAGAAQVAFASPARWSIVEPGGAAPHWHECSESRSTTLAAIVRTMAPADLIIVEGYKSAAIPKIEVRRRAQPDVRELAYADPFVFAIAADTAVEAEGRWLVGLDDVAEIAGQLERIAGLGGGG